MPPPPDSDGDGIIDESDNCPDVPNDQTNTDGDPDGAVSTIVVTDEEVIGDVDVIVNITHTYDGDLEISLQLGLAGALLQ